MTRTSASVDPMDWRAMSRSRSRISMDWRPQSRSRSRPSQSVAQFEPAAMHNQFDPRHPFPAIRDRPDKSPERPVRRLEPTSSPSIRIPGTSTLSSSRPSATPSGPTRSALSAIYEGKTAHEASPFGSPAHDRAHVNQFNHNPSTFNAFHPSSLPSFGLHGPSKSPPDDESPKPRAFPRHVRKTSFDHTVEREGIFTGPSGRHQVNGKPLSPDSLAGQKRRADAPHAESILRADPSNVEGNQRSTKPREADQYVGSGPFPSSTFNFSYTPFDGMFDFTSPATVISHHEFPHMMQNGDNGRPPNLHFHDSAPHSLSGPTYTPSVGSPRGVDEGISAAAAAAANGAMTEGYVQHLNAASFAAGDGVDYGQLLELPFPSLDAGVMSQGPYTHVDPTQILPVEHGEMVLQSYHASPTSDWGNGLPTSTTASPEPYLTSSASSPPSVEGANNLTNSRLSNRKISSTSRVALGLQRRRSGANTVADSGSETSTTEMTTRGSSSATAKGSSDDSDQPPTSCTNCQTTNTPLWRRDPEGQPLCECHFHPRSTRN